ncbi:phospholipase D-like domain-containing protein [Nonomuraea sp. NPDC050404]|uniref:phospholipase D-like domain-containing protein n=1 Tax=Nonomuraea sp. NPDC050404 TaxID=3155783 RepID=UPI0033F8F2C6
MPSKPLTVLAAGAAVAACVLTGASPAAAETSTCADAPVRTGADAPVRTGAVFSEPVGGDPAAIVRTLCGLVRQTPAGASIQIAHFVMSGTAGTEFAAELLEAHRRGVQVRVVLDGDERGAAVAAQLAAGLGTDTTAGSWLHVCTGPMSGGTAACIGNKGQHNKFYLFSRTGRASDVVVQSSANLTDLNSSTYWNNAAVLTGDRRLYAAYDSYFADLAAERKNLDYYRVVQTRSARAYFFPKAEGDPIVDQLGRVSCRRGTTIRVGMSEWDAYRVAIAERLRDLAGDGCRVQVVYGIAAEEVKTVLTANPRIELSTLGSGSALPGRIHSKYLLIEGSYDGDRDAHVVLTGSHNYNETSLRRNDETLLRLKDRNIYRQYVANFDRMRAAATS